MQSLFTGHLTYALLRAEQHHSSSLFYVLHFWISLQFWKSNQNVCLFALLSSAPSPVVSLSSPWQLLWHRGASVPLSALTWWSYVVPRMACPSRLSSAPILMDEQSWATGIRIEGSSVMMIWLFWFTTKPSFAASIWATSPQTQTCSDVGPQIIKWKIKWNL